MKGAWKTRHFVYISQKENKQVAPCLKNNVRHLSPRNSLRKYVFRLLMKFRALVLKSGSQMSNVCVLIVLFTNSDVLLKHAPLVILRN
jgi:hypothetical protein